jgi:signal transduction histidine kinase
VGAIEGSTTSGKVGYSPPCDAQENYRFTVYALTGKVELRKGALLEETLKSIADKTIAWGRLTAAHIELGWNLTFDRDISLTVVQWSALTRVMRELVSNAIAHAKARRVDIEFHLLQDRLELTITDNGLGRDPQAWAHGLGLGGVRKRVKQLGGEVEWKEAGAVGIRCRVTIRQLSERR